MSWKELTDCVKEDRERWDKQSALKLYLVNREFKLIFRYRLCNEFASKGYLYPIYLFERFLYHRTSLKCGCDIPSHVKLGKGIQLLHSWGIVINSAVVIGEHCTILSGAIIGKNHTGVPKIGNNVYIGAHAILLGNITIGDNATIGAGAIVTHDVPSNCVVKGQAATIR